MCALFPPFSPSLEPLMEIINTSSYYPHQFPHFSPFHDHQPRINLHSNSTPSVVAHQSEPPVNKKLYHNTRERIRRKKANDLYSDLRSLLPLIDQQRCKLSIPATVSRALKYIPELTREVERLTQKKQELVSKINSRQTAVIIDDHHHQPKPTHEHNGTLILLSPTVSASRLDDTEIMIHISVLDGSVSALSQILLALEEHGLFLLHASSFRSQFGAVLFYILHLQVEETFRLDNKVLREKLRFLYEKN